jgi:hypothetical protein
MRTAARARVSYVNLDHQTFGLPTDIGSVVQQHSVTDRRGRFSGIGTERHGVIASWEFKRSAMRAFRADRRFAYLDSALRTPDSQRTDWQRRVVAAIRTLNLAAVMQRPAMRIVLLATAWRRCSEINTDPAAARLAATASLGARRSSGAALTWSRRFRTAPAVQRASSY